MKGRGVGTNILLSNISNYVNRRIGEAAGETVDGIFNAGINRIKQLFGKKNKKSKSTSKSTTTTPTQLMNLSAIKRRKLGI